MEQHHQEIIGLALDKMLNREQHFSICAIDKLARTLGVNCEAHPDYKYLSSLHCVHYSEMSAGLKAKLPEMILGVLSSRVDTELMARALIAVKNGEVKSIPSSEDDCPTRTMRLTKW